MFKIDTDRYRLIDISYLVIPGEDSDRPFEMKRELLADDSFKHTITNTHTHVGTHVELAAHFYEGGDSVESYDLGRFFGRGIMVTVDLPADERTISLGHVSDQIDDLIQAEDIVVFRNAREPRNPRTYFDPDTKNIISAEVAEYLRDHKIKMVILGKNVSMGNKEEGRLFHDILMGSGVLLVEFVDNLFAVSNRSFFVMSLPVLVKGLDSAWCRAVVIEDK